MKKFKVEIAFECYSVSDCTGLDIDDIIDMKQVEKWMIDCFTKQATKCVDPSSFVTVVTKTDD